MSQEFYDDVYASGHVGQTDLQNMEKNFAALKTCFSGTSQPGNLEPGMWWYDTSNHLLKIRNEANSGWLDVWDLANNKAPIADTVDGIHASTTATANRLYPLNSNAKFPVSLIEGLASNGLSSFTSPGTTSFTVPSGVYRVWITLTGGGGGGGNGGWFDPGGGGGAGITIINCPLSVSPGQNLTVTVGAGGAAASNGGNTTVSGCPPAYGGRAGGSGGSNIGEEGSPGAAGYYGAGSGWAGDGAKSSGLYPPGSGNGGGASFWGAGGNGNGGAGSAPAASAYGAGGGAGWNPYQAGGSGRGGRVIIAW